ncbi:MAG TPA: hypothetical protein VG591_04785 [Burkholderiales bacterium]|nr:hypothetical protein [Burkholderiales bacterium]
MIRDAAHLLHVPGMRRTRARKRINSFARAAELSLVAPQVIALRGLRMHDRREMQRMSSEKVLAFWESVNAMGLQMARANQEYALFAMRQWWSPWMSPWQAACAASKVLEEGLRPIHRRASANARRLRRR